MRSIFYFDGTNMIRLTLVLCAWIVVGAALVTASALLPGSSGAADGDGGDGEATDRAVRELPGPAMAVEPSAIESPAGRAALSGNGANGFRSRPPVLFGKVTDAGGAPMPAANITIIDADGHQVLRTTTERHGRYAADGLPEGLLTVLVSPAGRMPIATPVMLAADIPPARIS